MAEEGRGGPADPGAAVQLFRAAMDASYPPAYARYARLLETGNGIAQDENQAVDIYLQAADLGDCEAMRALGRLYRKARCRARVRMDGPGDLLRQPA